MYTKHHLWEFEQSRKLQKVALKRRSISQQELLLRTIDADFNIQKLLDKMMATQVLLIRHALAEDSLNDSQLSSQGRLIQEKMSSFLVDQGLNISRILHSPLLRAKETAEILSAAFHVKPEEENALSYDFDSDSLLKKIPDPKHNKTIILVGHMPSLMHFAHALVGKAFLPGEIARSGVVVLKFDDSIGYGKAHYIAYYSPATFLDLKSS